MKRYFLAPPREFFLVPNRAEPLPGSSGSFPVSLYRQSQNADLVVLVPGIFQTSEDAIVLKAGESFAAQGHHVALLPSPMCDEYLDLMPTAPPGSFEREAEVILWAIQSIVTELKGKVNKVHLVGVSYGAFLASVVIANDQKNIVNGETILLSPQPKLANSLAILDSYMHDKLLLERIWNGAKSLFAQVFFDGVVNFTLAILENYNLQRRLGLRIEDEFFEHEIAAAGVERSQISRTKFKTNPSAFSADWINKQRFLLTLRTFTQENLSYYYTGRDQISFWLDQALTRGNTHFKILTTADDPVNNPQIWYRENSFPKHFRTPEYFQMLKTGSHAAYTVGGWFSRLAPYLLR